MSIKTLCKLKWNIQGSTRKHISDSWPGLVTEFCCLHIHVIEKIIQGYHIMEMNLVKMKQISMYW